MVFSFLRSKKPVTSYLKPAFSAPVVQKYAYHKRGCRRGGRHRWRPRRDAGGGGPGATQRAAWGRGVALRGGRGHGRGGGAFAEILFFASQAS